MNASDILAWRQAAFDRGYHPVPLLTGQKFTRAEGWQHPGPRPEAVAPSHQNTGILCANLRVIDIDVDDPIAAVRVAVAVERLLGPAPYRTREGSPRRAYLYRASEGEPRKRQIAGDRGKVEVLGAGQQLHAHGPHPSGAFLEWPRGGPADIPFADLPAVTEGAVSGLLDRCRAIVGAPEPEPRPVRSCDEASRRISDLSAWARTTLERRATEIAGLHSMQAVNLFRIALKTGSDIQAGRVPEQAAFDALMSGAERMPDLDQSRPWTRVELARTIRRGFAYAARAAV